MQLAPRISGGLGRLVRPLGLLWAVAVALLSPRAFAAAPMCDPSGASVVAPAPAPPSSTGDWLPTLAAKGCTDPTSASATPGSPRDPLPLSVTVTNIPDRALPVMHAVTSVRGASAPDLARALGSPLPGFSLPVYHPPR